MKSFKRKIYNCVKYPENAWNDDDVVFSCKIAE